LDGKRDMNSRFTGYSGGVCDGAALHEEEAAMSRLVSFLKRVVRAQEHCDLQDQLLRDIGLSRMLVRYA